VGDTINNWVGRLQVLWKNQSTTEDDAFQIARWFMHVHRWDYVILGNHDHWNQGGSIMRLLAEGADIGVIEDHEARIEYSDGTRLQVRHSFKGNSMWNPAHGGIKKAKMAPWGNVLVSGHHHEHVAHTEEHDGRIITVLKSRGFKRFDEFAAAHDFDENKWGCSITTVVDPEARDDSRVTWWYDVEKAARYLTLLRTGM
jgi:hypothetical protein